MNFSIVRIIRHALWPKHSTSISRKLWSKLLVDLRERGRGRRESGAFLLGERKGDKVRVTRYVLYDDLDPHSLDTGIVRIDGRYFGKLWDLCAEGGVSVIADVHTHPGGVQQSHSDKTNPMIACAGHIAFIIPNFAKAPVRIEELGMYTYLGAGRWQDVPEMSRSTFFRIGI